LEFAATQFELDALAVRQGGAERSASYQTQAGLYRAQGESARQSGIIGAGTALMRGGSTWGSDAFGFLQNQFA